MSKLLQALAMAVAGLVVLAAASRPIALLANALSAPIVVLGVTACLVRIVWWWTGPR